MMRRILLVDDYPEVRDILTDEFTDKGYQVTSTAMCPDLLKKIDALTPELLILGHKSSS